MKKTLIALAAVAATSAAFAQSSVTLSGKLRFAYEATESTTAAVTTKANGLRVTDGDFALTAVEDLGGGLKATAFMNVQSRGRDTGITGRDAFVALSGGFGSFMIGSVEAGNGIIGLGGAGAPVYGLDGAVIAGAANVDVAKYTSPSFGGATFSAALVDKTLALTMNSSTAAQDAYVLGVAYANGPLAAAADYTGYGLNAVPATTPGADSRVRLSAAYNLGVAKVGFGYETRDTTAATNNTTKDMVFGVSAPVASNVTVGFNYATSKVEGGVKVKGYDLGVKYDLSKRTYVAFQYQNVDNKDAAGAIAVGNDNSKYRLQLAHAF